MSNIAHFFDLNCLIKLNQQAWVVNKDNPNLPLYKIPPSEFRLIKSGIYAKKGNKIDFNGTTYYLPDELWNRLKIISSKNNINFSNFVISLQEFLNKDLINEFDYELNLNSILNLKNKMDDVYIICSKETKKLYEKIILKIDEELKKSGIIIKNFYYLNENFLNQKSDDVQYKKIRLLLQHIVGYKTDGDKFTDDEITKYDVVNFYDRNIQIKDISPTVRYILNVLISKTDKGLGDVIKDDLSETTPLLYVNRIEDNELNPISTTKIDFSLSYLIKKFEAFKNFKFFL